MKTQAWWADLPTETLTETAWERQMSLSGIEAYEQGRYSANGTVRAASESAAGQKTMRQMIDKATTAITEMQKDVLNNYRSERNLKGTVLLVPAETTALLTLRVLLDLTYASVEHVEGVKYQKTVNDVAKAIELELNFRNWVKTSKEASKVYAQAQGMTRIPKSMAERLIEEEGASRATMFRWKKSFAELESYKWDTLEQHYCGDAMVTTVCKALPETFLIYVVKGVSQRDKRVRMTDEFRDQFNDIEQRVARLQVVKKPMLARPRRWTKETT